MRIATQRAIRWRTFLSMALVFVLLLTVLPCANAGVVCAKDPDLFDTYGKVRNRDPGICAAVATVNSFVYLWKNYPGIYSSTKLLQDYDGDNDIDIDDHIKAREWMADGWDNDAGVHRNGVYGGAASGTAQDIWAAKLYWLEDFAPGSTIVDGQVWRFGGDFTGWYQPDPLENKYPEWSFLWDEVKACEDVELGIVPPSGEWHALTLTNLCFDDANGNGAWDPNETRKLQYSDPNGAATKREATVNVAGGQLKFLEGDYKDWYVYRAYTESPIPEPASIVVWSALLCFAVVVRRRRQRRAS